MLIRKISKKRLRITIISVLIIVFISILFISKTIFKVNTDSNWISIDSTKLINVKKWNIINVKWNLKEWWEFPFYTHTITDLSWNIFWLKTYTINLNNYTWQIEINWKIENIYKDLPIIWINEVKIPKDNIIIKDNRYFFVNYLIMFDFWDKTNYKVYEKWNDKIEVFFRKNKVLTMEPFVCNKVINSKNCDNILNDLMYKWTENFTSYYWNDYYKYKTWQWITFNKWIMAYIFTPVNDDFMLDIANIISIKDMKYILTKKQDVIYNKCQDEENELKFKNIDEVKMIHNKPKEINLIVSWPSNKWWKMNCNIIFDLRNNRKLKNVIVY